MAGIKLHSESSSSSSESSLLRSLFSPSYSNRHAFHLLLPARLFSDMTKESTGRVSEAGINPVVAEGRESRLTDLGCYFSCVALKCQPDSWNGRSRPRSGSWVLYDAVQFCDIIWYNLNNHNSAVLGVAGVANRLGRAIVRRNKRQSQLQISRDPVRMQAEGASDRIKQSMRSHRPRLFNRRHKNSLRNVHRRLNRSSCDGRHPSACWLEWLPQIHRQRLRSRVRCILYSP